MLKNIKYIVTKFAVLISLQVSATIDQLYSNKITKEFHYTDQSVGLIGWKAVPGDPSVYPKIQEELEHKGYRESFFTFKIELLIIIVTILFLLVYLKLKRSIFK